MTGPGVVGDGPHSICYGPAVKTPAALLLIPVVAACGRLGFEPGAGSDPVDPVPDGGLDRLTCGAPAQFSVGATTSYLAAAATPHGYHVFTVDDAGDVRGFTYAFDTAGLVPQLADVALASDATGSIGAVSRGDEVVLAMPYGRPDPIGTQLIPLTAQLTSGGDPAKQADWFGSFSALAATPGGDLAFLGQLGNGEVDAKLVSPVGIDLGAPRPVIDAADGVTMPTILPTATGFVVAWSASAPTPNEVRAEILDAQLAITTPPTAVSTMTQFDPEVPRMGYLAAADTYLFAWAQKTGGTSDQVWVSLRDGSLRETQNLMIGSGFSPAIVAGDQDFLLVWEDGPQLGAARVTADGQVTPVSVLGSGGKFTAWGSRRARRPARGGLDRNRRRRQPADRSAV